MGNKFILKWVMLNLYFSQKDKLFSHTKLQLAFLQVFLSHSRLHEQDLQDCSHSGQQDSREPVTPPQLPRRRRRAGQPRCRRRSTERGHYPSRRRGGGCYFSVFPIQGSQSHHAEREQTAFLRRRRFKAVLRTGITTCNFTARVTQHLRC